MRKSRQSKKKLKKKSMIPYLIVLIVTYGLSTGVSYMYLKKMFAFESSFIADIESRQAKAARNKQKKSSMRLYGTIKQGLDVHDNAISRRNDLIVVAEDMIRKTVKPYGVRLLDLYMDKEGIMYIDFGDELLKNFRGDAFEELNIIAGLYKGLKSSIPGFTALKIIIEGREVESFGSHIDISKPIGAEVAKDI